MVRARRAVRKPKTKKTQEYDSDDPDAYGDMEVPDKRSSQYMEDKVDEFHNARISKLLADGVQEESDQEELDEEEEVMALEVEEEEEEADDMESDFEGKNDDDLPNDMAWGHRKKIFYDTDVVTTKGRSKEEVEAEEQEEEEEAKNIQKRLVANLSEEDYDLNLLQEFVVEEASEEVKQPRVEERIVKDLHQMSQKEKLKLLKKESPELLELIHDFKSKLTELKDEIQPLVEMVNDGRIPSGKGADYIRTKQQLYLHYCTNISFYLVLKSKRIPAHNHPVIERLVTYRHLINELSPVDARLAPQLRQLLSGTQKPVTTKPSRAHTLAESEAERAGMSEESDSELDEEAALEFFRGLEEGLKRKRSATAPSGAQGAEEDEEAEDEGLDADAKRGITYQMAKNKGLTPKRKKIDRNPRVKHREKFRKAQIRRKGQVQQVQRELTRYSGEMSGIRAGVKKSIKLK